MQYIHWICYGNLSCVSVVKKAKWLLTQYLYCSRPYQSCGWRFKSFGMWYCVFGEVLGILKDHSASMFRVEHSKNKSDCLTMKMKVVWSLKMLGTTDPTRQCHIPEDLSLSQHCCEKHKFCILVILASNPILTWYSPCIWLQSCKSCPCGFRLGQFSFDPFWYL
jgi:hypothetical protein